MAEFFKKTGSQSGRTWYNYFVNSVKRTGRVVSDLKYHMVWVPK
jgi:hypothetical protein